MIGVIYKITSPSGRVYIGQSIDIEKRFKSYSNLRCKNQRKLYRSFLKYGFDNHDFMIIDFIDSNFLNERERYWQDYYNSMETGLNCLLTKTSDKSGKMCESTILKKSINTMGDKHWCWGKSRPDASKRMKENNPMKNPETVLKVKESLKGYSPTREHIEKYLIRTGRKNNKYKPVVFKNKITGDVMVMGIAEAALFFGFDRELISNRVNGVTKKYRKLKDWDMRYEDKSK